MFDLSVTGAFSFLVLYHQIHPAGRYILRKENNFDMNKSKNLIKFIHSQCFSVFILYEEISKPNIRQPRMVTKS